MDYVVHQKDYCCLGHLALVKHSLVRRTFLILQFFNVRQLYCARYSYRLDVRPSHAGIVSKRLNLSSNCLHCLVAPLF